MIALRSAKNTLGCLVGCAIGDLGAIFLFQNHFAPEPIPKSLWTVVWVVAMTSGIVTSIILETTESEGGLSDRYRDESAFHAADGGGDESGRLWNDGSSCNYPGRFTIHVRGGFSCGLALQLLAVEEARQELSLSMRVGSSSSISKLALLMNSWVS